MNGKRAAQLKHYIKIHVPDEYAHKAYRSLKRWCSGLCADHRGKAGKLISEGLLPVGPAMAVGTPGAAPPTRKRGRS